MAAKKLNDEQFFAILRANAGLFSRTATKIKEQYGIDFSRQTVRERAEQHPELLREIRQESIDIAEDVLQGLMRSRSEKIRLRAVEFFLSTIGKTRGYMKQLDITSGGKPIQPVTEVRIIHTDASKLKQLPAPTIIRDIKIN